ncbi:hypothetical protein ENKNEFLB_02840 [Nocardioides aquaticus]|uniref:Uncharacterized protein n=1 Tax=Nocardioides aquaticus TaxID=160826 RepID=A0ABX8EIV2_9ACTN|nr:hypothetical protein [Nocardioides aquaticus]QVT80445.1 hypothetical protein ENKNEFLB_02840 [Nocardioides aquaticus]
MSAATDERDVTAQCLELLREIDRGLQETREHLTGLVERIERLEARQ